MSRQVEPYAVLGVPPTASQTDIRRAFRRLARAYHPDANAADPSAEAQFKRLARAWALVRTAAVRRAYDQRRARGRLAGPGEDGRASYAVDQGPIYHSDLGHHSDFYRSGDPLTVTEAAELVGRNPAWLRRAVRAGRLPATRGPGGYLLRRRDVERLDRVSPRRPGRATAAPAPGASSPAGSPRRG